MRVDKGRRAAQRAIARKIANIGFVLPGTVTVRAYPCGKPNCACHGDPPRLHGPYAYWTRKVDGKTVTRILTEEQMADYGPLFDNEKRLNELLAELHEVSIGIVTDDERGQPRRKRAGRPRAASNSSSTEAGRSSEG